MRAVLALLVAAASPSLGADVTYFPADKVSAAFAKGTVLFDGEGRNYMVHASRRDAAGQAEVHVRDADIIDALVDLRTADGVHLVKGEWRYGDVRIVEVDAKGPGPDLKPSGAPIKSYDYTPKAGAADFDDSAWEAVEPTALEGRRSTGKVCF